MWLKGKIFRKTAVRTTEILDKIPAFEPQIDPPSTLRQVQGYGGQARINANGETNHQAQLFVTATAV
jgi:hypothetical protein